RRAAIVGAGAAGAFPQVGAHCLAGAGDPRGTQPPGAAYDGGRRPADPAPGAGAHRPLGPGRAAAGGVARGAALGLDQKPPSRPATTKDLTRKPKTPRPRAKNGTMVPMRPALDFLARSQTMKAMNRTRALTSPYIIQS